jgi:3-oxoacyl-[acyl-carrier protein] reductase
MTIIDTALITGATEGIGRATAKLLAAKGCRLVTVDLNEPRELLEGETFLQADLSHEEQLQSVLARVRDEFDISILVNNVAAIRLAPLGEVKMADLAEVMAMNVGCALQFAQAVLPKMKAARYGRIVNLSSRAALGKESRTTYGASKAAVIGMTRTWSLELAPHGITVNAIGPGPIGTEMFQRANPTDSAQTRAILNTIPVGRLGAPDEVAHAVAFFADRKAGFITGQTLYVCGGMTVGATAV